VLVKQQRSADRDLAQSGVEGVEGVEGAGLEDQAAMGNAEVAARLGLGSRAAAPAPRAPAAPPTREARAPEPVVPERGAPPASETAPAPLAVDAPEPVAAAPAAAAPSIDATVTDYLNTHYVPANSTFDGSFDVDEIVGRAVMGGALGGVAAVPVVGPLVNIDATLNGAVGAYDAAPDAVGSALIVAETGLQVLADVSRAGSQAVHVLGLAADTVTAGAVLTPVLGVDEAAAAAFGVALEVAETGLSVTAAAIENVNLMVSAGGLAYGAVQSVAPWNTEQEQAAYAAFGMGQADQVLAALCDLTVDSFGLAAGIFEFIPGGDVAVGIVTPVIQGAIGATLGAATGAVTGILHESADVSQAGSDLPIPDAVDYCPLAIEALLARRALLDGAATVASGDAASLDAFAGSLTDQAAAAEVNAQSAALDAEQASVFAADTQARNDLISAELPAMTEGAAQAAATQAAMAPLAGALGPLAGLTLPDGVEEIAQAVGLGDLAATINDVIGAASAGAALTSDLAPGLTAAEGAFDVAPAEATMAGGAQAAADADGFAQAAAERAEAYAGAAETIAAASADATVASAEALADEAQHTADAALIDAEVDRQSAACSAFAATYGEQLAAGEAVDLWEASDVANQDVDAAADRIAATAGEDAALDFQATWSTRVAEVVAGADASPDGLAAVLEDMRAAEGALLAA
jgi:hypothetical protein